MKVVLRAENGTQANNICNESYSSHDKEMEQYLSFASLTLV